MNVDLPKWLTNWISISKVADALAVNVAEEQHKTACLASIDVIWRGSSSEQTSIQLDMQLDHDEVACSWKPHLCPQKDMIIGDLVFRSPVMIFEKECEMLALVPDLDFMNEHRTVPHFFDYVEPERRLYYGIGHYEKTGHVYHRRLEKPFSVNHGQPLFRFYIIRWDRLQGKRNFIPVAEFLWSRFAKERMMPTDAGNHFAHLLKDLEVYAKHTYNWAFNRWEEVVWQEFELMQKPVGGCVFIVRATQAPGTDEENQWREKKSLWNQAWFSSLRSAYGYRLWGEHWNDSDLIRRAERAKNFALSAPQNDGLFPSVYTAADDHSWENGSWGYSDRRPVQHEQYGHLLDMSWTCIWMLKWYQDIDQDQQLLDYTKAYVCRLLELQAEDGSFPAWFMKKPVMFQNT